MTETDDLVQDALAQTFRRLDYVEANGVGALGGYLRQAVLNRIRDELRRSGRTPPSVDLDTVELPGGQSPLEQAIGRESVERYERALQQLNAAEREAIVGRLELGYSYEELAEALGKPSADAARKAAQRALLKLAEELRR
jgi:RNA polymerase sigma-70 factor (ECF subfamily)